MSRLGALYLTKHTGPKHTATVIVFHGSGGNGENMKEWVNLMTKKFVFPHIKVLYPTAPLQPYTPSNGMMSNVWFDRTDISLSAPEMLDSLDRIKLDVLQLIKKENELGIPNNRIIVGGFSMGGALSFHIGYRWVKDLAGVFAFSSFLNEKSIVYEELKGSQFKGPPLFQVHGDSDMMVDLSWGHYTHDTLTSHGVQGEFHVLQKLGHSLNKRGMNMIKDWIDKILPDE
ncbi:lysophospholipase-like protein 1 isoform X1 [Aricia agestis]|uniref:lysophospholipase-like protein 1 isoform X1 n=1 Tax=Aricia agestis TaxID=91739 RepID=UPI001C20BE3E|nr:lysophospholipase-like protein 1 isoform X1 [Aricia agestis]XP_041987117.1 lysophospholipase-like protein 1 isoform X1 [Aricia agestis]